MKKTMLTLMMVCFLLTTMGCAKKYMSSGELDLMQMTEDADTWIKKNMW